MFTWRKQLCSKIHIRLRYNTSNANNKIELVGDNSSSNNRANVTGSRRLLNVAIVGKPNVGKSTLFNRFCKSKKSIVSPIAGTTRDRKEGIANIAGLTFNLIDTGGLDDRGIVSIDIQDQIERSLIRSDIVLFMVDGKNGINTVDASYAQWIRKKLGAIDICFKRPSGMKREVILVSNKIEGGYMSDNVLNSFSEGIELGWGTPLLISASHGDGIAELAQEIVSAAKLRCLDNVDEEVVPVSSLSPMELSDRTIQMALMGRPNVGKSSLLNAILKDKRAITGPVPGLTRDSVFVEWYAYDRYFSLVDTAGLSRIRVNKQLESYSLTDKKLARLQSSTGRIRLPGIRMVDPEADPSQFSHQISEMALQSALNALRFAQVVVLVVEGNQGNFSDIDLKLARKCMTEGRALIIAANKRDMLLSDGISYKEYEDGVRLHCEKYLREFGNIPIVSTCAIYKPVAPASTKQTQPLTEKSPTISESVSLTISKASEHNAQIREQLLKSQVQSSPSSAILSSVSEKSLSELANIMSAEGIDKLMKTVIKTHDAWSKRISTWVLNSWLKDLQVTIPMARYGGRPVNVKYMTQIKIRPPSFALFCNTNIVPQTYLRFLRSHLQKDFSLDGVPLRFIIRKTKGNPTKKHLLLNKRRVGNAGQTRPLGEKRRNPYLERKRKAARDIRRRRSKRLWTKSRQPVKGGNRARPPSIFFRRNKK